MRARRPNATTRHSLPEKQRQTPPSQTRRIRSVLGVVLLGFHGYSRIHRSAIDVAGHLGESFGCEFALGLGGPQSNRRRAEYLLIFVEKSKQDLGFVAENRSYESCSAARRGHPNSWLSVLRFHPAKLMNQKITRWSNPMRGVILLYAIATGLAVSLSTCANLTDVLCRPAGHCPNAPDGINKDHS